MTLHSIIPRSPPWPEISSHPLVLCIDDDEVVLDCVTSILERAGYSTLRALSGMIGIQTFKDNAIDLVVVDGDMPGMDGCEVAEALRRLNSKVPIIMNSGNPEMSPRVRLAVDDYVRKGSEFSFLLSAIANLLTSGKTDCAPTESNEAANVVEFGYTNSADNWGDR